MLARSDFVRLTQSQCHLADLKSLSQEMLSNVAQLTLVLFARRDFHAQHKCFFFIAVSDFLNENLGFFFGLESNHGRLKVMITLEGAAAVVSQEKTRLTQILSFCRTSTSYVTNFSSLRTLKQKHFAVAYFFGGWADKFKVPI